MRIPAEISNILLDINIHERLITTFWVLDGYRSHHKTMFAEFLIYWIGLTLLKQMKHDRMRLIWTWIHTCKILTPLAVTLMWFWFIALACSHSLIMFTVHHCTLAGLFMLTVQVFTGNHLHPLHHIHPNLWGYWSHVYLLVGRYSSAIHWDLLHTLIKDRYLDVHLISLSLID